MSLGLCAYLELFNLNIGKQARMKSKPGSNRRQERNFEIVVNHIITNEDQLPQVSQQSMAALNTVFTKHKQVLWHFSPRARQGPCTFPCVV